MPELGLALVAQSRRSGIFFPAAGCGTIGGLRWRRCVPGPRRTAPRAWISGAYLRKPPPGSLTVLSRLCEGCPRGGSRSHPLQRQGYFLSLQRPKGAVLRRVCLGWQCVKAATSGVLAPGFLALGVSLVALAQPSYFLLGHEAPDFALHAVTGSNVRPVGTSRRRGRSQLLEQPLHALSDAAGGSRSQSRDLSVRGPADVWHQRGR